jgi:hypothetical protein
MEDTAWLILYPHIEGSIKGKERLRASTLAGQPSYFGTSLPDSVASRG